MDRHDVEILERRSGHSGFLGIEMLRLRHRLFRGGWSAAISREVLLRGRAVAVLLYDPDRDRVVMVEQFRVGALAAGRPPWVRELVAGLVDAGEDPHDVARREVLEESGLQVSDLTRLVEFLVSPGCSSESVVLFLGRIDSTAAGGIHGLAGEHEDIRVVAIPRAEALADLEAGRIDNAITLVGLQWLALNHARLAGGRRP